jgi:hypothetical protein
MSSRFVYGASASTWGRYVLYSPRTDGMRGVTPSMTQAAKNRLSTLPTSPGHHFFTFGSGDAGTSFQVGECYGWTSNPDGSGGSSSYKTVIGGTGFKLIRRSRGNYTVSPDEGPITLPPSAAQGVGERLARTVVGLIGEVGSAIGEMASAGVGAIERFFSNTASLGDPGDIVLQPDKTRTLALSGETFPEDVTGEVNNPPADTGLVGALDRLNDSIKGASAALDRLTRQLGPTDTVGSNKWEAIKWFAQVIADMLTSAGQTIPGWISDVLSAATPDAVNAASGLLREIAAQLADFLRGYLTESEVSDLWGALYYENKGIAQIVKEMASSGGAPIEDLQTLLDRYFMAPQYGGQIGGLVDFLPFAANPPYETEVIYLP